MSLKKAVITSLGILALNLPLGTQAANPPNPDSPVSFTNTFDSANVDGSDGDWQPLANNESVGMYIAGNPSKDKLSTLYLRYDCSTKTLFGLVLKEPVYTVVGNAWIKIYELGQSPRVSELDNPPNGTQPEFSWVPPSGSVQPTTEGYEASFNLAPGSYTMEAHLNIDNGSGSQTSSTGRNGAEVELNITCPTASLEVSKTANPVNVEKYDWTIEKTVSPDSHTMFAGDPQESSAYIVKVDQTKTTTPKLTGTITIKNPTTDKTAKINHVIDTILPTNLSVSVEDNCTQDGIPVTLPYDLLPGKTLECTYTQTDNLPTSGDNEVIVIPQNGSELYGGQATAPFVFNGSTPSEIIGYPTVDVKDTKEGTLQTGLGENKTFSYDTNFVCPTDLSQYVDGKYEESYDNTATIEGTKDGQTTVIGSDQASVKKTCYAPVVSKTAEPSIIDVLEWTIDKQVTPDHLIMNIGDSGQVKYTVSLGTKIKETNYAVEGTITVKNPRPDQVMALSGVSDALEGIGAIGVDCPTLNVPASGEIECSYSTPLANDDTRQNTATATLNGLNFDGTAKVDFTGVSHQTKDPDPVSVTDSNSDGNPPWGPISQAGVVKEYEKSFTCSTDKSKYTDGHYSFSHDNTAKIEGTDKSDTVSVKVDCYAPIVSKTANPSFIRTYQWNITKKADKNDVLLQVNESVPLTYSITVNKTGSQDSDMKVSGDITVVNPNPEDSMLVNVADNLPGAVLGCGGTLDIPKNSTKSCSYEAVLPNTNSGTNTATVTLNGVSFDASAPFTFGAPSDEKDECIDVTDKVAINLPWTTNMDIALRSLGTVCITDTLPKTFIDGTLAIPSAFVLGPYMTAYDCQLPSNPAGVVDNTATFTTKDTGTTGSASEHVRICVPKGGCTLTLGFWKTHSIYGPAKASNGWFGSAPVLENGVVIYKEGYIADFFFFKSGQTYYQVLRTAPAGNAYYNLAHQWIAAYLNQMNGASMPADVQNALNQGLTLLAKYSPADVLASKTVANQFKLWYPILDQYNQGLKGTPHCTESPY